MSPVLASDTTPPDSVPDWVAYLAKRLSALDAAVREIKQLLTAPPPPPPETVWLTIKQCIGVSGYSDSTLRRAIYANKKGEPGGLVHTDKGTWAHPIYRIHRDDLDAWCRNQEAQGKRPYHT